MACLEVKLLSHFCQPTGMCTIFMDVFAVSIFCAQVVAADKNFAGHLE